MFGIEHEPIARGSVNDDPNEAAEYIQDDPAETCRSPHTDASVGLDSMSTDGVLLLNRDAQPTRAASSGSASRNLEHFIGRDCIEPAGVLSMRLIGAGTETATG